MSAPPDLAALFGAFVAELKEERAEERKQREEERAEERKQREEERAEECKQREEERAEERKQHQEQLEALKGLVLQDHQQHQRAIAEERAFWQQACADWLYVLNEARAVQKQRRLQDGATAQKAEAVRKVLSVAELAIMHWSPPPPGAPALVTDSQEGSQQGSQSAREEQQRAASDDADGTDGGTSGPLAPRCSIGGNDGTIRTAAEKKLSSAMLRGKPYRPFNAPDCDPRRAYKFDERTLTAAHLVTRQHLRYFSMYDRAEYPDGLQHTAAMLGPFPADQRQVHREGKQSVQEQLGAKPGQPLLQWSTRDMLYMPKGLEQSMELFQWVLEPMLPSSSDDDAWLPTTWRIKCLADVCFDAALMSNTKQGPLPDKQLPPGTYNNFKTCTLSYPEGVQCLVPLKELDGHLVELEWDRTSMRALVYAYVTALWHLSPEQPELLVNGLDRVEEWVATIEQRKRDQRLTEDQADALSLPALRQWLDGAAAAGCEADVNGGSGGDAADSEAVG